MAKHGKKYQAALEKVEADKLYTPLEAAKLAKEISTANFDESVEVHFRLNVDTRQADQQVENDLIEQVVNGMQAEIPQAMYDSRVDELVRDFEYRLSQQGLKMDMYLQYMGMTVEQLRAQFADQAEKQVKMRLAMEAIVAKENIVTSDEEFEEEVKRIADAYKMEPEKVKSIVDADAVKKDLAVNKAIDLVKEKANVTTEQVKEEENA